MYQNECFYEHNRDCGVLKASAEEEKHLQQAMDPYLPIATESHVQQKVRATVSVAEVEPDSVSVEVLLPAVEMPLPQIFGPETFELEFLRHRTQHRVQHWSHYPPEDLVACTTTSPQPSSPAVVYEIVKRITPPEIRKWFRRPYDVEFLAHLLDLYFSWIHPSYQFFSQEQFLLDFQSGKADHCGKILVNAIAAFACRYSDRAAALADPDDPGTAGDQFFAEAARLLCSIEQPSTTLAQALCVMSSRELSCGRISTSLIYAERLQNTTIL